MEGHREVPGSTRVPRVGCGVPPQRTSKDVAFREDAAKRKVHGSSNQRAMSSLHSTSQEVRMGGTRNPVRLARKARSFPIS